MIKLKLYIPFLIKAAISVGLMWWLVGMIDTDRLLSHFNQRTLFVFIGSVLTLCLIGGILGYRWSLILQVRGYHFPLIAAWKNVLIGFFFNQFLPSTVGGDAARIWLVHKDGIPLSASASSILADRIFGFISLVLICALGMPFLDDVTSDPTLSTGIAILIGCAVLGVCTLFGFRYMPRRWKQATLFGWVNDLSVTTTQPLLMPTVGVPVIMLSLAVHTVIISIFYAFAFATDLPINWIDFFVLIPPVMLVSAVPISVAGWGVREGIMTFVMLKIGIEPADAVMLSVFYGATEAAAGGLGGLIWMTKKPTAAEELVQALSDEGGGAPQG